MRPGKTWTLDNRHGIREPEQREHDTESRAGRDSSARGTLHISALYRKMMEDPCRMRLCISDGYPQEQTIRCSKQRLSFLGPPGFWSSAKALSDLKKKKAGSVIGVEFIKHLKFFLKRSFFVATTSVLLGDSLDSIIPSAGRRFVSFLIKS